MSPMLGSSAWGSGIRAFGIEAQWDLRAGAPKTGGNRDSTLGGGRQGFACTWSQGKAVISQESGPDQSPGLGGSPGEAGFTASK